MKLVAGAAFTRVVTTLVPTKCRGRIHTLTVGLTQITSRVLFVVLPGEFHAYPVGLSPEAC